MKDRNDRKVELPILKPRRSGVKGRIEAKFDGTLLVQGRALLLVGRPSARGLVGADVEEEDAVV